MKYPEKTLFLNGEEIATGTSFSAAMLQARGKGYKIPTKPASDLANGKNTATDKSGTWEFK